MKVLAICGSPRIKGNTSSLLKSMVEHLNAEGVDTQLLMLSDLKIEDCNGCLVCEDTDCTGDCTIEDDMQKMVVPELLSSNALVLGTPSYFDLPTAQMKRFMDRTNMILTKLTKRKLPVGIIIVGQSEIASLEAACEAVRHYCGICEMNEVKRSPVFVIARDIGDASRNTDAINAVKELGREIAGLS
ncbi:flavodoxin family protein [Dehalococcoidia bacterium]|nr:flavodoxin family protein [Dehalococcoidia bacterium]